MGQKRILILDDEKNIRLTLAQSLESIGFETETAVNGEEALTKVENEDYGLLLLDLRLPGMDGMEVLRRIREFRPDIGVIVLTAYGTIDLAVRAMKLGAVDFIQKPFAPQEIREAVLQATDRERLDEKRAVDYASSIELGGKWLDKGRFDAAAEHLRNAVHLDMSRPEAFQLMGRLMEMLEDMDRALKYYRAALSFDPTFEPAQRSLEQTRDRKEIDDRDRNQS